MYRLTTYTLILSMLLAIAAGASSGLVAFAQVPLPVSGAFVTASSTSGVGGFGAATSDAFGFYNITTFLDSGNYSVQASATGFIDTSVQNIRVNVGQETPNVNILMPVSGAISGRITDAVSGAPLPSIVVGAENVSGSGSHGSGGLTNSNGNYLINTDLVTGIYNVSVPLAAGYLFKSLSVQVTAGTTASNINIALDRSATISGTITDSASSAPLSGISVYAVSSTGSFSAFGSTNSSGKYTLNTNLGTGTYNVTVILPPNHVDKTVTGVAVVAGNPYTVNLALDPSGVISGRVTSAIDGTPIAGATVSATSGTSFGFATTNSTGYYRIGDGLKTGSYTVFASYGGAFNTVLGVAVTQGQETGNVNLQLTLTPSGTITGRVTNSTGSPLESATVEANGLTGSGSATTDSNGNYIINTGLLTGTYNVTASKTGYNPVSQTGVVVTVNQVTSQINFALSTKASGRISGLVQSLSTAIPEFHTELYMLAIFVAASIFVTIKKMKGLQLGRFRRLS